MAGSRQAWQGRAAAAALALAAATPAALRFAGPATPTPAAAAPGTEVAGPARVIDGDTLAVGAVRVRLFGVDAPEHDQTCGAAPALWPCGAAAARRLGELAAGGVRCSGREHDRYGRLVASCDAGGVDLGGRLVAEGLAWAFVRYSDAYVGAEADARARHAGLWAGDAEAPWDFRAGGFVAASGTRSTPAPAAAGRRRPARPPTPAADAGSRATSVPAVAASTTCPATPPTPAPGSTPRAARHGSATPPQRRPPAFGPPASADPWPPAASAPALTARPAPATFGTGGPPCPS
ncbi:MAG: thermonuclease family protein [Amaricoccus sp.]